VGFAALTMNRDIGLSPYVYGWGAGIFYLGYCLFEVPSNLILVRTGARRWIARILATWGVLSCGMAFVHDSSSFLILRFLLGVAEAGFFPGVMLYLSDWFPARYRGRIVGAFMLSIPLSVVLGAPLSGAILQLDGWYGWRGWQWLFMLEGVPAVLASVAVLLFMTGKAPDATWLKPAEKAWLAAQLEADRVENARHAPVATLGAVFRHPVVLALSFVYFCSTACNLGLSFFLPQMIQQQGYGNIAVGFLTAVPYVAGCAGMLLAGYWSDLLRARRTFLAVLMLIAGGGLAAAAWAGGGLGAMLALCVAAVGIYGCKSPFWPLSTSYLGGTALAGGIAFISSVGNLGGFVGPYMVGWIRDASGGFAGGLYFTAALGVAAALVALTMLPRSAR
jgi:ACS family tartrate transporter-like MFS transporter